MEPHGFLAPPKKPVPRIPGPPNPSSSHPILAQRPLSDIREITEPSLWESTRRKEVIDLSSTTKPLPRPESSRQVELGVPISRLDGINDVRPSPNRIVLDGPGSRHNRPTTTPQRPPSRRSRWSPERSTDNDTTKSSLYSINPRNIPPRSSSRPRNRPSHSLSREPAVPLPSSRPRRSTSNRRKSASPLKDAAQCFPSDHLARQRVPSKTYVKVDSPTINDIIASPIYHHPRIQVELQMAAPLFVGGSTVEGIVRLVIDEAARVRHRKTLNLERLSIDLLGVEEVFGNKRHVFLSLGNELVDDSHPPPEDMVESQVPQPVQGQSWLLIPSITRLPFLLTLPLEVGPPPFKSKNARIRYLLSATLTLKDTGRQLCVRSTQETSVLSVYDPERALVSLPSPLTSSDEMLVHRGREKIRVAAGLHRQVWVNGTTLFADVHIINSSRKQLKRIELHLEQIILFYRHAAASTLEQSASQARLFDETERTTICKNVVKQHSLGWPGVAPHSTDLRTCSIDLPRGYATIKCNKYFEVRYLLNVIVPLSSAFAPSRKTLMIQLPIILIHMSSLDVPTNSVAQVAAAIEEKRNPGGSARDASSDNAQANVNVNSMSSTTASTTVSDSAAAAARGSPQRRLGRKISQNLQGRAFAAPRAASIERHNAQVREIKDLGKALEKSPRKYGAYQRAAGGATVPSKPVDQGASVAAAADGQYSYRTPPPNRAGQPVEETDADEIRPRLGSGEDTTRSFKILSREGPKAEPRDPPRSASAMGYYMPGDRDRENRRPSLEAKGGRRSFDGVKLPTMMGLKEKKEGKRVAGKMRDVKTMEGRMEEGKMAKVKEWRDGGRSPVGGVQLAGVPEAPRKKGEGEKGWGEREKWRPHWL